MDKANKKGGGEGMEGGGVSYLVSAQSGLN